MAIDITSFISSNKIKYIASNKFFYNASNLKSRIISHLRDIIYFINIEIVCYRVPLGP